MKNKRANPHQIDAEDMPADVRNFRWAYALLLELAKDELRESNRNREHPDDWPGGQEWGDLVGSSKSVFLRKARERAGINHEEFLSLIRNGTYEVDDLYDDKT